MRLAAGLLLALLSTAAISYGFYLQHKAAGSLPPLTVRHPVSSLRALFAYWKWLAGFATGLGGWALYIVAVALAPLALVQATSAGSVGFLALFVQRGGGRLSRPERLAVAASVAGLALIPACHGLAFVALQLAFQRGTAMATAGVSSLLTNAAPIIAGLTIFSEPMPGGVAGVSRMLGFAGAVLGAALLAGRAGEPAA